MKNMKKTTVIEATVGIIWLLAGTSCEKEAITRSLDEDFEPEKIGSTSGISFELENDSLEEVIENIRLEAEEWKEESRGVDL